MADLSVLARAAALGAAAGMRSMAAPAALSRHMAGAGKSSGELERLFAHPSAPTALRLASVAELVADKLPIIPNRTDAGPLGARMAAGALCGAVVARRGRESAIAGALVGALAAAAATFAAYHVRRALTSDAGLPDLAVAVGEDMAALAVAEAALRG
ncbi:MAG TPA: DUF4126 family protein [Longimicrobium sp.]|nr:DUF4126 family protein [Longimicrobium sp.]